MMLYPLLLLICGALAVPQPGVERRSAAPQMTPLKNAHIVVLSDEVGDSEAFFNSMNLGLPNGAMHFYNHAMKGFSAQLDDAVVALLRRHPQVVMVEPDGISSGQPHEDNAPYGLSYSSYPKRNNPANDRYYWAYDGTGVTAYVIDSGLHANQPEFQGRATKGPNFVTRQYGSVEEENLDYNGHGTSVTGCVGSKTYGIAKGVNMVGVKVLDANNDGTYSAIIAGIDYAIRDCANPAKCVINQSTGGPIAPMIDTAVQNAVKAGITYVVSAGNQGVDACTRSPADVAQAITVGAIDDEYVVPGFSNYGDCVDVFAAGVNVLTTTAAYPKYPSRVINGTSFSSPYVAGIAAIYLSATAATPHMVKADLKEYGLHGAISNLRGSPNLLAGNGYYTGLYTANPTYN